MTHICALLLCFIILIVIVYLLVMMMCEATYSVYIFTCFMFNHHWTELGSFKCIWNVNVILYLGLSNGLFPSNYHTKALYETLLSPIHAACPTHIFFLDLITQMPVGEKYRWLNPLLCRFLHSPVTSWAITFSSATHFQTSSAHIPPQCEQHNFAPIQITQ